MCLDTITKRVEKPSKKVTRAWKIFYKSSPNELSNFYYGWISKTTPGRWQTAKEVEVTTDSKPREIYLSGFHCYLNKEEAQKRHAEDLEKSYNVLIEVKVKEITTYGTQWKLLPCESIVARQMLVPRQPKTTQTKK